MNPLPHQQNRTGLISPCGIYCGACPSWIKGTCKGCQSEDRNQQRTSKWACKIRSCCVSDKILEYCGNCSEFPCKTYHKKLLSGHVGDERFTYRFQTRGNFNYLKVHGKEKCEKEMGKRYTCSRCNGIIAFYSYACVDCGFKQVV